MRIAIMQPYFLPYIGYWQLLHAADIFVVYDDVNYIKRGWINRNRLLENGKATYFNVCVSGASQNKYINEIDRITEERCKEKVRKKIEYCYKKAPYFQEIYPLIKDIIMMDETNLSKYLTVSIVRIANYLDINTEIICSSRIEKNCSLKGQDKILDICERLNADVYFNAIGGQKLYDKACFTKAGIRLFYIQTENIEYKQFQNEFVSNLSILDVLMFNGKEKTKKYLECYQLI